MKKAHDSQLKSKQDKIWDLKVGFLFLILGAILSYLLSGEGESDIIIISDSIHLSDNLNPVMIGFLGFIMIGFIGRRLYLVNKMEQLIDAIEQGNDSDSDIDLSDIDGDFDF